MSMTKKDGSEANVPFRGLTQDGFAVHPEIKIIQRPRFSGRRDTK